MTVGILLEDKALREILDFIEIRRDTFLRFSNKENERKKTFRFSTEEDFIAITKSVIPTLVGKKPNDWSSELMTNDIYLKAKITKANRGTIEYSEQHFQYMVSPYHAQPVFEDYLIYPQGEPGLANAMLELEVLAKNPEYSYEVHLQCDVSKGINIIQ